MTVEWQAFTAGRLAGSGMIKLTHMLITNRFWTFNVATESSSVKRSKTYGGDGAVGGWGVIRWWAGSHQVVEDSSLRG